MNNILNQSFYHFYNKPYEKFTPDYVEENLGDIKKFAQDNSETLVKFFEGYQDQFNWPARPYEDLEVLDLGAGLGGLSLYLAKKGYCVSSLDISNLALMVLERIFEESGQEVVTYCEDITKPGLSLNKKFDLIIDSHLLHCLISDEDRKKYFTFVKDHLKENGRFLAESMAYHPKIQVPIGYEFDESNILWQEIEGTKLPVRRILPSLELENEISNSGLKINYLYYHSELSFQVFPEFTNYPHNNLPKTIRFSALL